MQKAISMIYIKPLLEVVEPVLIISVEQLLEAAAINPALLTKNRQFLSLAQYKKLTGLILTHVSVDALICSVSDNVEVTQHGLLGLLVMCGLTVRHAVKALMRFYKMQAKIVQLDFHEDDEYASIVIKPVVDLGKAEVFTVSMGLLALLKAKQQLVGDKDFKDALYFTASADEFGVLQQHLLPVTCHFSQPECRIIFPQSHLDVKIKSGHEPTFEYLSQQCEKVIGNDSISLADTVRNVLVEVVHKFPTQRQVAQILAVSPRTLSRQLKREGCTFQYLLDQERIIRAKQSLLETDSNITRIANDLCFTDASHFSKVFKRCTGLSPTQYRELHAIAGRA